MTLSDERGALMFSDLYPLVHTFAPELIGVCFILILLVPVLLAMRIDLNADDLNQFESD
jgi:hypothetical protein